MAVEIHAIPGARFMDPAVLARIGNLELVARSVVDGFINGMHRSPYFGASVDFAEHRGYMPGDDIRRVGFTTAFRGYRMDEVDALLDRLAAELDARDRAAVPHPVVRTTDVTGDDRVG